MALAQRISERRAAHKLVGPDWLYSDYRLQWETRRMRRRAPMYKAVKSAAQFVARHSDGPDLETTWWPRVGPDGVIVWIPKLTTMVGLSEEAVTNELQIHARTNLIARLTRELSIDEWDQLIVEAERRADVLARGEQLKAEFQSSGLRPTNTNSHHLTDRAWVSGDLATEPYDAVQRLYAKEPGSFINVFFSSGEARSIPGAETNTRFVVRRAESGVDWSRTGTLKDEIKLLRDSRTMRLKRQRKFLWNEVKFAVRHLPGTAGGRELKAEKARVARLVEEQAAALAKDRAAARARDAKDARSKDAAVRAQGRAQTAQRAQQIKEALDGGVAERPGFVIRVADLPAPDAPAVYHPLAPVEQVLSRPVVAAVAQFRKPSELRTDQALRGPSARLIAHDAAIQVAADAGQIRYPLGTDPFTGRSPLLATMGPGAEARDAEQPDAGRPDADGPDADAPAPDAPRTGKEGGPQLLPGDLATPALYAGFTKPRSPRREQVQEGAETATYVKSAGERAASTPRHTRVRRRRPVSARDSAQTYGPATAQGLAPPQGRAPAQASAPDTPGTPDPGTSPQASASARPSPPAVASPQSVASPLSAAVPENEPATPPYDPVLAALYGRFAAPLPTPRPAAITP
ncbi:MAG: hypothetical protein HOV68_00225, partial [Streptomycetaceae bacterium]|nr:hypothetical protein [Streptomycetaceae bacterium]